MVMVQMGHEWWRIREWWREEMNHEIILVMVREHMDRVTEHGHNRSNYSSWITCICWAIQNVSYCVVNSISNNWEHMSLIGIRF